MVGNEMNDDGEFWGEGVNECWLLEGLLGVSLGAKMGFLSSLNRKKQYTMLLVL
jgi:hypothetical protein